MTQATTGVSWQLEPRLSSPRLFRNVAKVGHHHSTPQGIHTNEARQIWQTRQGKTGTHRWRWKDQGSDGYRAGHHGRDARAEDAREAAQDQAALASPGEFALAHRALRRGVGNFIAVGLNFADHAAETGAKIPAEPILFNKSPSSIMGPNDRGRDPEGLEEDRLGGRARHRHRQPRAQHHRERNRSPMSRAIASATTCRSGPGSRRAPANG